MAKSFTDIQKIWKRKLAQERTNLFIDQDFPPEKRSLVFTGKHQCDNPDVHYIADNVVWRRPREICYPMGLEPKLVVDSTTLFDLNQGRLGDCWYIAGIAHLAIRPDLFKSVVPVEDQDFQDNYTGMFHFWFWRFGKWVEVIVDDFLPCAMENGQTKLLFLCNRREPNEFWAALLEKAYAKLNGCYEALDGGFTEDAMVDISGGIGYQEDLSRVNQNDFFQHLLKCQERDTLMGCYIIGKEREQKNKNGLYALHAYTVTKVAEVKDINGMRVRLIRLRNPWGRCEWNGQWSDIDRQSWSRIDAKTKVQHLDYVGDDGEFWMGYEDFLNTFTKMNMCFIPPGTQVYSPAAGTSSSKVKQWNCTSYGEMLPWVKGQNAGGPSNMSENDCCCWSCCSSSDSITYWDNPQHVVDIKDPDENDKDNLATMIISLMKHNERVMHDEGDNVAINFDVYQVYDKEPVLLNEANHEERSKFLFRCLGEHDIRREVARRQKVPPGRYFIIPNTESPNQEARYLLRIFTESPTLTTPV